MNKKINILMCSSDLSAKGGMVSVVKNYIGYDSWGKYNIIHCPTHIDANKIIVTVYFFFAYIRMLFTLLTKKIDIAHLHTAERGSFFRKAIILRTLKRFGIKTVMHHHAAEFEEFYAKLSPDKKEFVNKTLEMADINIVLSNTLVSMIKDKAPNARVEVLYNAVNTYDKNPYNAEAKNILFLGRLGERKGTYDLLQAIKQLDNKIDKEIKFYICGDGEIAAVTQKVKELGIEHRIAHIGWIDGEQKKEFLKNTCINVLPSYNEGLPMTILETMAYGIPNISTNIASIPEVIKNGETGYLIEPGDVSALEECILKSLKNKIKLLDFSNKSYELINLRFKFESHIRQLMYYYSQII